MLYMYFLFKQDIPYIYVLFKNNKSTNTKKDRDGNGYINRVNHKEGS